MDTVSTAPRVPLPGRVLLVLLLGVLSALLFAGPAVAQSTAPSPAPSAESTPAESTPAESTDVPAADEPAEGEVAVNGTLNNRGERLAGVDVRAVDAGGAEVTVATSDDTGRWELFVPEGTYTFELVQDTLPDGVTGQGSVTRAVAQNQLAVVLFSFGEVREGNEISYGERVLRLVVDGLRFGLVIAITAVGLSLIYGTTGLTNFAHGELVTIGAVAAWLVNVKLGVQLIPATLIAIVIGVVVGMLNDLAIWRPLRRRRAGLIAQLVVSIGLAIALRYLILVILGGRSEAFTDYQSQTQREIGPIAITDVNIATIGISLVVLLAVALLLQRTRIGKAMRAVSDNRDLAASSGIDTERVVLFVWALGGGLAALGGVLYGLSELAGTVQWEMGFKLLLLMFAGVTLGGLGTAYGALVGCIIVGLLVQLSTLVIDPDLKYTGGLLVLIVILVLRPQGILGSRTRIG